MKNSKFGFLLAAGMTVGGCGDAYETRYDKNGRLDEACVVKTNYPENMDAMPLYSRGAVENACVVTPDESVTCLVVDVNGQLLDVINAHCHDQYTFESNGTSSGSVFEGKMDRVYVSPVGMGVCRMGRIENLMGCY